MGQQEPGPGHTRLGRGGARFRSGDDNTNLGER